MEDTGDSVGPRVLAVLDDTAGSEALIEWSSALAHALQRPLALVYVESAPALAAAVLPFTQVLAHAGAQWAPFGAEEVERGYRVHAARLRALADRITPRLAVRWSLRSVRGVMPHAAYQLIEETDLLFVGSAGPALLQPGLGAARRASSAPVVGMLDDGSPAGERCLRVGRQLAQALNGRLLRVPVAPQLVPEEARRQLDAVRADLLVLPAAWARAQQLANARRPVLVVA